MFGLFFMLLFSINSTNVSTNQLSVLLQANNEKYWMPDGAIYSFRNNEKVSVDCFLNCTECSADTEQHLYLYISENITDVKRVTVDGGSAINISNTFTLRKDYKEIYCDADFYSNKSSTTLRSIVKLEHLSSVNRNNRREEINLKPYLEPPKIRLSIYKDTDAIFAMFECTAYREELALLSLYQVKGKEHILLETVSSFNLATARMNDLSLKKTLLASDHGTELFCDARYFLEGLQLSNRIFSETKTLTFERKAEALAAGERHIISNSGLLALLAVIGSVAAVAIIIVVFMVAIIVKYRRKVKELERLEALRNRMPVPAPTPDSLYEPVYSHGAGLKRPRMRPTEKRL